MKTSKYEILIHDVCLPSYFGGHHLPAIQVPLYEPMTIADIKKEMKSEVNQMWDHYEYQDVDFDELMIAIDEVTNADGLDDSHLHFTDVEFLDEDDFDLGCESVCAYFVIATVEE